MALDRFHQQVDGVATTEDDALELLKRVAAAAGEAYLRYDAAELATHLATLPPEVRLVFGDAFERRHGWQPDASQEYGILKQTLTAMDAARAASAAVAPLMAAMTEAGGSDTASPLERALGGGGDAAAEGMAVPQQVGALQRQLDVFLTSPAGFPSPGFAPCTAREDLTFVRSYAVF